MIMPLADIAAAQSIHRHIWMQSAQSKHLCGPLGYSISQHDQKNGFASLCQLMEKNQKKNVIYG